MASQATSRGIQFHYSYGGDIVPRKPDGRLVYVGGTNGVLPVEHDITYTELIVKLWDTCGASMRLRCKLPGDELDVLLLVTCDEDLSYVIEEYDRCHKKLKIRAVLDDHPRFCWDCDKFYGFLAEDCTKQSYMVRAGKAIDGSTRHKAVF